MTGIDEFLHNVTGIQPVFPLKFFGTPVLFKTQRRNRQKGGFVFPCLNGRLCYFRYRMYLNVVLPPGEWDPAIRLEPPEEVPSQVARRKGAVIIWPSIEEEGPEEEKKVFEQDPVLLPTGRIFGGLIADVKRRLPHFLSDFTDALHFQCVASFIFLFLATLAPTITFGGMMGDSLDYWMVRLNFET